MPTETRNFALRLDPAEDQAIRAYAEMSASSMNDVIRRAVREFLAADGRRQEIDRLFAETRQRYAVALDKLADL